VINTSSNQKNTALHGFMITAIQMIKINPPFEIKLILETLMQ